MTETATNPDAASLAELAQDIRDIASHNRALKDQSENRDHTRRFLDWGALAGSVIAVCVTVVVYVTETNAKPSNDQVAEMIAKAVAPLKAQAEAQNSAVKADIASVKSNISDIKIASADSKIEMAKIRKVQDLRYYQNLHQQKMAVWLANHRRGREPQKSKELEAMEAGMTL